MIGASRPAWPRQDLVFVLGAGVAMALVAVLAPSPRLALYGLGILAGTMVVVATAWRPLVGGCLLAVGVPLTAGLGRDTVLPVLRVSEALTILVAVGFLLYLLPRRRRRPYCILDLAVLVLAAGGILVPIFVLLFDQARLDVTTVRYVLAPAQYVVIYLIFSRTDYSEVGLRTLLRLVLATSLVVAVVGILQLADVLGVRDFINSYYLPKSANFSICQYGVCRPTSLLEHWSAFGAFAVMNYTIALTLLTRQTPGFSSWLLLVVMTVNAVAAVISLTQAAVVGLVVATGVVVVSGRRFPRELGYGLVGLAVGALIFLPAIEGRVEEQFHLNGGGAVGVNPQSLQTRERYWTDLFLPALEPRIWLGTGTVIPSTVPDRLQNYVDNEYLRMAFRAGVVGLVALALLLGTLAVSAACLGGSSRLWQAVGTSGLAYAIAFAVMGVTAEYTTYAGVAQQLWMVIGLVGAGRIRALAQTSASSPVTISGGLRGGIFWSQVGRIGSPKKLGPPELTARVVRASVNGGVAFGEYPNGSGGGKDQSRSG